MENSFIDLIIRIKNGYLVNKKYIISPYSKFKLEIVKKLKELKFIKDYKVEDKPTNKLIIELLYQGQKPAITEIKIYSRPGKRYYVAANSLKPVLANLGYSFLTTAKGILTNKEAKRLKIGGELLFNIW